MHGAQHMFKHGVQSMHFYITERGHEVTVKAADDPSLQLSRFGEYIYQNLVILAPGVEEFGGALSVEVSWHYI